MSKVKMAILGCGGMSGAHAQRYKGNPDVQIVALCDVKAEIVEGYIARNLEGYEPKPQVFTDYADMLANSGAEAVTIVTPHTMHFEHGLQAIKAGYHVFMEKPMVTESGQAHELKKAVEESGKILVVGYNTPCTPAFNWLREKIRSGEFGRLETVTGWQTQNWLKGTTGTWRQDPSLSGGGQMYDSGAHMFNSLVWSVEEQIESVFAFTDNVGSPVDINGTVNIRFKNGILATMTISGNCLRGGAGMYYAFENALVEIDGWGGNWLRLGRNGHGPGDVVELEGEAQMPNDNFIEAIQGKAQPKTSPLNGVIQSELMDAIYESARTGAAAKPVAR
jgi:predicted dehydrogenase